MQKHPSQDIILRRVIGTDLIPRYHSICANLRHSTGSIKPPALTRRLRRTLLGCAQRAPFKSSARKGWDPESARRRVSTLPGSLNAACSSVFVTAFIYEISCIISAFSPFVNAFLCRIQSKFQKICFYQHMTVYRLLSGSAWLHQFFLQILCHAWGLLPSERQRAQIRFDQVFFMRRNDLREHLIALRLRQRQTVL